MQHKHAPLASMSDGGNDNYGNRSHTNAEGAKKPVYPLLQSRSGQCHEPFCMSVRWASNSVETGWCDETKCPSRKDDRHPPWERRGGGPQCEPPTPHLVPASPLWGWERCQSNLVW
jgi:hypothetical protein